MVILFGLHDVTGMGGKPVGSRWLDQSEWEAAICDDMPPVLKFLEERYGFHIEKIHLDMKAVITEVHLNGDARRRNCVEQTR